MTNVQKYRSSARGLRGVPAGVFAACLLCAAAAFAQTYPNKPIKALIPWPGGGPTDVISRILMVRLSERLGQPIVIDNRPGGNGIIGLSAAAKAPNDGYSLLIADVGSSTILPALRADLPYDTLRDFQPVSLMVSASLVLFVNADLPIKSVADLVAYAKANPGKLSYGSVGQGSSIHLATELLKKRAGIDMVHVPYKGGPQLITDVIGGRIDVSFISITSVRQVLDSGKLRPLGVSTRAGSGALPGVPPIAETFPDFDVSTWFGLLAPTGTPRPVIDRLQKELAAIVKMPDIVEQMKAAGQEPEGSTPEEYGARLRRDIAQWADVVKSAGIKEAQ